MGLLCLSVVTSDAKLQTLHFHPNHSLGNMEGKLPGLEMAVIKVSFR